MSDSDHLGAVYSPEQTRFNVISEYAEAIELCLFDEAEKTETRIPLVRREDNLWTAEVPGLKPGQKYGYRAYGPYNPEQGLFFNPHKLAVDPYGLAVSDTFRTWRDEAFSVENDQDTARLMPKSVVVDPQAVFDPEKYPYLHKRPQFKPGRNIIYETHIKNFSVLNKHLPPEKRGRLSALSDEWTIRYLNKLGVNNIELMPITPTCPGRQIPETEGRCDSWGYNPYCYFAVDPRYGSLEDLAQTIDALHRHGMKVTVDAVLNHTGEHAARGYWNRALSFKLLDSPNYYRPQGENKADYMNTTGCHNNFNLDSKSGRRLLHDFINHMHKLGFDGIRWDLAADNALDKYGIFQNEGAFIQELRYAVDELKMEMYVEPWSAMGGNYTGRFAGLVPGVKEWSDKRRDFTADFYSGRDSTIGEFGNQSAGSAIIDPQRGESAVVGTAFTHDGFSLVGAFKYHKDTTDNGEGGRDGSADHYAKSYDQDELYRRSSGAVALNILSKGMPLLRNGDERSYASPNNNPYCIDDHSVWINWKELEAHEKKLFLTISRLNAFRQRHPVFTDLKLYTGKPLDENGVKDITWLRPDGNEMTVAEWTHPQHKTGAYMLNGAPAKDRPSDDDFLILASGDNYHTVNYRLPVPPSGGKWQLVVDTAEGEFAGQVRQFEPGSEYALRPYAFVVLTRKKTKTRINQRKLAQLVAKRPQKQR